MKFQEDIECLDSMYNAVYRGAKMLDREHPNWYIQICQLELSMCSANKCLLGQLAATLGFKDGGNVCEYYMYMTELQKKEELHREVNLQGIFDEEYGFEFMFSDYKRSEQYEQLGKLWRYEINERLDGDNDE